MDVLSTQLSQLMNFQHHNCSQAQQRISVKDTRTVTACSNNALNRRA